MPVKFPYQTLSRAGLVIVASAMLFAMVYVLAVGTALGQRFDDAILDGSNVQQVWFRWAILRRLTYFSAPPLILGALLALGIAIARRRWYQTGAALVLIVGSFSSSWLLKKVILPRPFIDGTQHTIPTLPSGHTTVAVSVAVGLLLVVPQRWRGRAAGVLTLAAACVGSGTLAVSWHRPSDAIASALLVAGWSALVIAGVVVTGGAYPARSPRAQQLSRAFWPLLGFITFGSMWALWRLRFDLVWVRQAAITQPEQLMHVFNTGDLMVVISICVTMASVLWCLEGLTFDPADAMTAAESDATERPSEAAYR